MNTNIKEFVNPYNFISNGNQECKRINILDEIKSRENNLTGYIDFNITTKTPLFIPNTNKKPNHKNNKIEDKDETLEFFTYSDCEENEPVIPGSSIRGMIRNIYETLTNSCMSVIDGDSILYKRTADTYLPGLLKYDRNSKNIKLYKANVCKFNKKDFSEVKLYDTCKVEFDKKVKKDKYNKITKIEATNIRVLDKNEKVNQDKNEGYILIGEQGPKMGKKTKHNSFVFSLSNKEENAFVYKEAEKSLQKCLDTYASKKVNKNLNTGHGGYRKYKEEFEKFKNGKGNDYFPVYYSTIIKNDNEKIYYLSPACITKEVYNNTINDLIKEHGRYDQCIDIKNICHACALFGMVGEGKVDDEEYEGYLQAWSSKLRFEDGKIPNINMDNIQSYYDRKVTLQELSNPKISSTEFYLKKPTENAHFWTYDYYCENKKIKYYVPEILGRKFYWHNMKPNIYQNVKKNERNKTVTPIKSDVVFNSRIYFENINKKQLEQIIWICNISKDNKLGYKLGLGKPLGLGSVKLNVSNVKIRSIFDGKSICYKLNEYDENREYIYDYEKLNFNEDIKDIFYKVCEFDAIKDNYIRYPLTESQSLEIAEKGYEWFSNNRYKINRGNNKIGKRNEIDIAQYLEELNLDTKNYILKMNEEDKNGSFRNRKLQVNYEKKETKKYEKNVKPPIINIQEKNKVYKGRIIKIEGNKVTVNINNNIDGIIKLKKSKSEYKVNKEIEVIVKGEKFINGKIILDLVPNKD